MESRQNSRSRAAFLCTAQPPVAAGAGSTGGILAACIGKLRKVFRAYRPGLFQNTKEE
jgi:hypothetical protein